MTERFEERTHTLLHAVRREGSVRQAALTLDLDPSNALRHLRAAERRAGASLVHRARGGRRGGGARLTAAGRALLEEPHEPSAAPAVARWFGKADAYDPRRGVTPVVVKGRRVHVAGRVPEGDVEVVIRPQDVALTRGAGPATSVQNAWAAVVRSTTTTASGVVEVTLDVGGLTLWSLVTRQAVRDLRLRRGSRVTAGVKATALVVRSLPASPR